MKQQKQKSTDRQFSRVEPSLIDRRNVTLMRLITLMAGCSVALGLVGCSSMRAREAAPDAARQTSGAIAPAVSVKDAGGTHEASAEYHFSMAQAYVAEGNPDRAIEEFKLTLMYDPSSPLVYARLATEYVKKGMLSAAMETCKEALQRDPNYTDARLMLAGLYSNSRDFDAALKEYGVILKADPKNEEATIYKSQVEVEDGRPNDSVKTLRAYLKKNSDSVLAYYYLGRAEQTMNHFKEAVVAYRKSMNLRPTFTQPALALGFLYEEKGMIKEAVSTYQEIFESTQDLSAANRLATLYLKEEKYQQAIPYLEMVQASDPEDLNVRVKLGLIQMEMKQYDKAIAQFKSILAKAPDSDRVLYYLGSLYEETQQMDLAIQELRKIKPGSKIYPEAAVHVAFLMKQTQKMDEAKAFIREAIAKSPDVANFYVFQASLEEESKNVRGALKILEGAAKKFSSDEKILYYLGSLYDRDGNTDKGLETMEAILKVNADNVDALNYIGYTWTSKGIRLDDAEKLLKRALALRPDNGYVQDSWGWYLFTRGKISESVVELEKAVKLKPNESTILEHLGDAYVRANLEEKAWAQYRNAVRYAEDDTTRKKLEQKAGDLKRVLVQKGKLPADALSGEADRTPANNR